MLQVFDQFVARCRGDDRVVEQADETNVLDLGKDLNLFLTTGKWCKCREQGRVISPCSGMQHVNDV